MFKRNSTTANVILFLVLMTSSLSAHAYIGPGLGAGTIGVVLGILASLFLVLLAILWYPIKRLLKKRKQDNELAESNSNENQQENK